MDTANGRETVDGLWNACSEVENVASVRLQVALSPFEGVIECCYESGVQVPTLPSSRHSQEDVRFSALFLKRTLTDLRSVWLLLLMGYTSQAASVAAALFEHALAVNALAGNHLNVERFKDDDHGNLPWSPIQLSKIMAEQNRNEAKVRGEPFTDEHYAKAWREVYAAYKLLCKIKHPTLRSTFHDALNTQSEDKYVVMAAPDLRSEDLPLKATILVICISRTYQAIRRFCLSLRVDAECAEYEDFLRRFNRIVPDASKAYRQLAVQPLPFDIADDTIASDYYRLRKT